MKKSFHFFIKYTQTHTSGFVIKINISNNKNDMQTQTCPDPIADLVHGPEPLRLGHHEAFPKAAVTVGPGFLCLRFKPYT